MSKAPENRPSAFDLVQALANIEASLNVINPGDPDATQLLPRSDSANLSPRRNPAAEKNSDRREKPFYKSKIFMIGMAFVLLLGFGVGTFMAFGKFWSSEEVPVPDVKGKQLALARQILEDGRLRVNVAETYDASVPAGQVVSQDPDPGRSVKVDRLVTIYVSKGGESIEMPDLVGLTKSAATERLQKLGLNLGSVYEKDSDSEPGTVVSHDPAAGTKIVRGQNIDLVVSRGDNSHEDKTEKIHVPDVRSASLDVARSSIESHGLRVGSITYQKSNQAADTVVSQTPSPDSEVEDGSAVDLVIASSEDNRPETREAEIYREHGEQNFEESPTNETETNYSQEEIFDVGDAPSREGGGIKNR